MEQRNKIISLMLAILLIVGMLPISAIAADTGETYTLTLKYAINNWNNIEIGAGIADKEISNIVPGTVIDLSDYWPEELSMSGSDDKTYYFAGFVENSDGDGTPIHFLEVESNKTLYAGWALDSNVSISLDTNGGMLDCKAIRYPTKFADIDIMNDKFVPVRDGYTFLGWSLENDGTADDAGIEITTDCTLYAVWEEIHSHCVCGGNTDIGDHTSHSDIEFTPWDKTDSMPTTTGNYVLMNDVTLDDDWETADGTVLCLNGKTLTLEAVNARYDFTLCDCAGNGKIIGSGGSVYTIAMAGSATFTMYGGTVLGGEGQSGVYVYGNFNMYGGTIKNGKSTKGAGVFLEKISYAAQMSMYGGTISENQATDSGGGVYIGNGTTFTMNGGTVTNNTSKETSGGVLNEGIFVMTGGKISGNSSENSTGGGVWSAKDAKTSISGNAVITENAGKDGTNNLHLASDGTTDAKIAIGAMGTDASVGVSVDSNHGMIISDGGKDYKDKFFSDNGAYSVAVDGTNLKLVEAHIHDLSYSKYGPIQIIQTCTGCSHEATATLRPTVVSGASIYDCETDFSPTVEYSDGWIGTQPEPVCFKDDKQVNESIDVGEYIARLTVSDVTAEMEYSVIKRIPTVSVKPTVSQIVVGNVLSSVVLNGGDVKGVGGTSIEGKFDWSEPATVMSILGTQAVEVTFTPDSDNYESVKFEIDVNVVNCDTASGEHDFTEWENNDTDHWLVCAKCEAEKPGSHEAHKGGTATCEAKAKCEVCGEEYGELGAHGETEIKNAKEATCTEEGYTGDKHCKVCGEMLEKGTAIAKTAHTYENGKCTVCGAADPNYKTDSPQTGDNSHMALWIALLFISGVGLAGTLVFGRKKRHAR